MSYRFARLDAPSIWMTASLVALYFFVQPHQALAALESSDETTRVEDVTQPRPTATPVLAQPTAEATEQAAPPELPGRAEVPETPQKPRKKKPNKAAQQAPEEVPVAPVAEMPDSPAAADVVVDVEAAEIEAAIAEVEPWTAERTIALLSDRAVAHGASVYEVLAVARCETGYTFLPWRADGRLLRGSLGEVGVGQWLPPVERYHWGRTPHWREYQYHILVGYQIGDPDAIWWDVDALAWSMGPSAPPGFRAGWSCWRMRGPWWNM